MKRVLLALLLTAAGMAQTNAQSPAPTTDGEATTRTESVDRRPLTLRRALQRASHDGNHRPRPARSDLRHRRYDGKSVPSAKADVRIDVSGISTQNAKRDGHLRSDDFFDAANHPFITFTSKRVEPGSAGAFKLIGDLTIRGTTKEVVLNVEGPTPPVKGMGGLRIGATATTKINRLGYGLKWNSMVEAGPVVSDEVSITIDLELTRPVMPAGTQ